MPRPRAFWVAVWLAWLAWVVLHAFRIPGDGFVAFNGPLPSAAGSARAVARGARAIGGALVVVCAAWGIGSFVVRRVFARTFETAGERVSFTLALGFGALSYALLALAFAGLYRPVVVAVVTTAAAAWGIVHVRRPRVDVRVPRFDIWLVLACALLACGFAFVGALAPESEYDALAYHLWLPSAWLRAGHPVDIVDEFSSLFPLTWELLYGAASVLGGPIGAKLLHWLCLPLAGLASFQLTRRIAPDASPALAAALTMTTPIVMWESTTAYIDLALAWYVALAVYALIRHDATRERRWLVLAALMLGLALSIKHLALIVAAIATAALLVREWRRGRGVMHAARTATLFTAISVLVPSVWYARAYAASGNPVFPELYRVFGARPSDRWSDASEQMLVDLNARYGRPRSIRTLVMLPWDMTAHAAIYGGTLGPAFLVLIPVLVCLRRRPPAPAIAVVGAGCAAYVALWASPLSSFQMRFVIPIVPLLAALGAEGASRLAGGSSRARMVVMSAVALLLIVNLPPAVEWHERDRSGWDHWLTHVIRGVPAAVVFGGESESDYLARTVPSYQAWRFIDSTLPASARVLTFSGGDHLYGDRPRVWSDATAAVPILAAARQGEPAAVLRAAAVRGITHLLIDKREAIGDDRAVRIADDRMRRCCLAQLYEDKRFVLFAFADGPGDEYLARNRRD